MPRGRPKAKTVTINELLQSLLFVGSVLKDQGSVNETHILLSNGYAVAFNGIVASGTKITSDIFAAANYSLLIAALAKCGEEYTIVQEGDKLKITSGKFRAIVPCLDPSLINVTHIDPNVVPINDDFKIALNATGALASDNGQTIHSASILMNGQSLISTENGVLLFEYWHGCQLPINIAIPKALVAPLTKTTKKLTGFGYSDTTVTFYFDDNSWIRSQLFSEKWPSSVFDILNYKSNQLPISKDIWEAISAIEKFSPDGILHSRDKKLYSHSSDELGASYECSSIPSNIKFSAKQFLFTKDWAETIDFFAPLPNGQTCIKIFGNKMRGMIAGRVHG